MKMMNVTKPMRLLLYGAVLSTVFFVACSSNDDPIPADKDYDSVPKTQNGTAMLKDKDKIAMVRSLVDLEGGGGRIYEMNYTVDYKLDAALNFGIYSTTSLTAFVARYLMDTIPGAKGVNLTYDAGCSAFACPDASTGDFLMGRNFDFNHINKKTNERIMIPLIAVHTAPAGGKKSVSFVDGQFVGYKSGFFTDGKSDLSMLMALPYLLLDGINEDGFAVSVLKLDGKPTRQEENAGNKKIFTTVAMRMLLDRAGTVNEAVKMLENYNMWMDEDLTASYHFFMADATGDYAIVEYTNPDIQAFPNKMEVLRGNDTLRYTTNFYVSPTMANTPNGFNSNHGKYRYEILKSYLAEHNYQVPSETEGMGLLKSVAQGPEDSKLSTGFTQWSEIYNLSKKKVTMSILREFDKKFEFGIE